MGGYLSEISEIHVPYCLFPFCRFAALPRGKPLAEFAAAVTRHA